MNKKQKTKIRTRKRSACSGSRHGNVGDLGVMSPRILNQGDFGQLLASRTDPWPRKVPLAPTGQESGCVPEGVSMQ